MKLFKDFGVSALLGTLIIVGSFVIIGILIAKDKVEAIILLPMIGSWVGSVVTAYFVIKSAKETKNH